MSSRSLPAGDPPPAGSEVRGRLGVLAAGAPRIDLTCSRPLDDAGDVGPRWLALPPEPPPPRSASATPS